MFYKAQQAEESKPKKQAKLTLSNFVESSFRLPIGGTLQPFSFEGRRYLRRVYDTPSKKTVLLCGRQVEKTVEISSTYVSTSSGQRLRIDDVPVGAEIASMGAATLDSRVGTGKVSWRSLPYLKPVLRITTRQGHVITVGEEHPLRTFGQWTKARDLSVGSRLAVVRKAGEFLSSADVQQERTAITAFMLGDGCMSSQQFSFTTVPGLVLDEFTRLLTSLHIGFSISPRKNSAVVAVRIHVGLMHDWFAEDSLVGTKSATKFVPPWVFTLPRKDTAVFLNRLWSTDGHTKQNTKAKYSIEYCSISKQLVLDVQALLWKFGIPSKIRENWPALYKRRGEEKLAYILRVETQQGIKTFLGEIGALGKAENIELPEAGRSNNRDTFPLAINALIREIICSGPEVHSYPQRGKSLRSAGLRHTLKYPPSEKKVQQYVKYFRQGEYDQSLVNTLASYLQPDVYWDSVISVETLGDRWCMDISVDTENFIANGFITHNSTSLGNKILSAASLMRFLKILYVAPRQGQAQTFSRDRLKQPLLWSDFLGNLQVNKGAKDNAMYKTFVSGSEVRLGYAFLTADAIRGIMTDLLFIDELQNILASLLPVIEECTFSSEHKQFHYAGTPLTESNTLSRTFRKYSTQNEWLIPCDRCGGGDYRYWNQPGEENIGTKYLICAKCGEQIYPMHPEAQWIAMNPDPGVAVPFEGFHIPQIISPRIAWPELLDKRQRYPRAQFLNEVLGLPHDVGSTPITEAELRKACDPRVSMYDNQYPYGPAFLETDSSPKWMGADWGTSENSYTVSSVAAYLGGKFTFLHFKKFTGVLADPDPQISEIERMMHQILGLEVLGADYGGGWMQNDALTRRFGARKIAKYQYAGGKNIVKWESGLSRFIVNRTEIMSAFFNAIKNGHIKFPRWEEFKPFAEDFLSIYTEYRNEEKNTLVYDKLVDGTDDAFHSAIYCWLASMLGHPRPDLLHAAAAQLHRE